jgi:opacity protein-like surface antigen
MKLCVLFAAALATISAPVLAAPADSFTGVRVEATAGVDDVTRVPNTADVTYGAGVGLDTKLTERLVVGVEANVDNVFNYRDVSAAARVGIALNSKVMPYVAVGYTDFRGLTGLRYGGGLEVNLNDTFYVKAEGRYADLQVGR